MEIHDLMTALESCGSYTVYVSIEKFEHVSTIIGGHVRIACIWIGFSDTVTQNLAKFALITVYFGSDAKDS